MSPVVIISAARSGTKMLRYVLSASEEFAGYPYDANYVWKYGNYHIKHDEINPSSIGENQKKKIRHFFLRSCRERAHSRLLEKSVSNSLRIPFVRSVFPNCKIIHLYRNGFDVAADARLCWQDSANSERIQKKEDRIRKLKEFPISMAWPYLLEYAKSYGKKALFKQAYVESWGPRYKNIDRDVQERTLIEVCAMQWAKCVEHCCMELEKLENGNDYIDLSYEALIAHPLEQLTKVIDFLKLKDGQSVLARGQNTIKSDFVGSWKNSLSSEEVELIDNIIHTPQQMLNRM